MRVLRRFFSRWQNWISILLILTYVCIAVAAPYLSPDDPKNPGPFMQVGRRTQGVPQPPGETALLGMFPFGVDVYHALVWGARDALLFGLIVTISIALFGILYGAVAGFAANRFGTFLIRLSDVFLAFPPIAGLVFFQQMFLTTLGFMGELGFYSPFFRQTIDAQDPRPLIVSLLERVNPLMLSLIIFSWMPYARLVHSIVLTLTRTEFVQAARALGGSPFWIIRKHILRNSLGPAIVLAARDVGGVVLLQATLTFIQIGGDSVWGAMLSLGRNWVIGPRGSLLQYWWVYLPATLAVMIFGITWNMFGDGLHDALEPTSQRGFGRKPFWNKWRRKSDTEISVVEEPIVPVAVPAYSVQREPVKNSEPLAKPASPNGLDLILAAAREDLLRGDMPRALHAYTHLIRRGMLIEEVLPDLTRLVKNHPHDPQVWQTLGDALASAGHTEHASQSYEQARKLRQ
ncbi:MAG TPA: ABC transporter permease subunit [Anaerolineales bacterium]|nr:ABC transporter permease subunit [Anaerolineales bacterium]